jgi:3,4-dihydroxy 2-butanone 4-phosphate synthase/GTP cyclohydrolase II
MLIEKLRIEEGIEMLERSPAAVAHIPAPFVSVECLVAEMAIGRPVILHDGAARQNRGDLVLPAQCVTAGLINFMAREARGLICLALTSERAAHLHLELQSDSGMRNPRRGAFTVSIEANDGVETGISSHDRAHTIAVATDINSGACDLVSPGHVFPVVARDAGVLERAGHTEAAVALARLAGFRPMAVMASILNGCGDVSSVEELAAFARRHGLAMGRISDLVDYSRLR